ncbi:MAG: PstS family phosphate ABC transporter substrate-binding protein [Candidatus Omnitrophica bacterium]|jgi:phosphate transport system substrate-binding protein|nr:PstS family phosphate ABC transporter substrate-binding protein [Candidatus Omnitrophota bacterium]
MRNLNRIFFSVLLILGLAIPCFAGTKNIKINGSTTVLPIAQACAEKFMEKNSDINISVQGGGSGVGISSLIDKTTDIADSSRAIKDTELDKAVANGVEPKAHVVAMDGIALVINPSNNISALTKKQIRDIYTGAISNWSQLGGPDEKIVVVSRDTSSGTFEAFNELALDKVKVRTDALMEASNQAVVSVVDKTPGAVGYVGLGYIQAGVKAVSVNGIMPSKETVLLGKYPISRPLFMYTNGAPQGAIKKFIDFVLSQEGQKIADEQGYVGIK